MKTSICSNGGEENSVEVTVVKYGQKQLLGPDVLDQLRVSIQQSTTKPCLWRPNAMSSEVQKRLSGLEHCVGYSKKHIEVPLAKKPKLHRQLRPTSNKSSKNLWKLDSCSDQNSISLIATTLKRDQSVKSALDSKIWNKSIPKEY